MRKRSRAMPPVVLTVGHSSRTLAEFVNLLRVHEIGQILDVRKLPGSTAHPHFNEDVLAAALEQAGIGYVHVAALGGLRRPAADSPNGGWRNRSFQGYADYMQTEDFEKGLQSVLKMADDRRVALMCAEAVPWRCHRSLIADALVAHGVPVEHILSPTRRRRHTLRPFAQVHEGRLSYPPTVEGPPSAARDSNP